MLVIDFLIAIQDGNLDKVKSANVQIEMDRALDLACQYGHLEIVKYLISKYSLNRLYSELQTAVKYNQTEVAKYLMNLTNYRSEDKFLEHILKFDNLELFIELRPKLNLDLFVDANRQKAQKILMYILDHTVATVDMLCVAVFWSNVEAVQKLIPFRTFDMTEVITKISEWHFCRSIEYFKCYKLLLQNPQILQSQLTRTEFLYPDRHLVELIDFVRQKLNEIHPDWKDLLDDVIADPNSLKALSWRQMMKEIIEN